MRWRSSRLHLQEEAEDEVVGVAEAAGKKLAVVIKGGAAKAEAEPRSIVEEVVAVVAPGLHRCPDPAEGNRTSRSRPEAAAGEEGEFRKIVQRVRRKSQTSIDPKIVLRTVLKVAQTGRLEAPGICPTLVVGIDQIKGPIVRISIVRQIVLQFLIDPQTVRQEAAVLEEEEILLGSPEIVRGRVAAVGREVDFVPAETTAQVAITVLVATSDRVAIIGPAYLAGLARAVVEGDNNGDLETAIGQAIFRAEFAPALVAEANNGGRVVAIARRIRYAPAVAAINGGLEATTGRGIVPEPAEAASGGVREIIGRIIQTAPRGQSVLTVGKTSRTTTTISGTSGSRQTMSRLTTSRAIG